MFTAAKPGIIIRGKIVSLTTTPTRQLGHTRTIPQGIETSAPSYRMMPSTGREHPVGVKSSAVSFVPATEPEAPATLEPVSLV